MNVEQARSTKYCVFVCRGEAFALPALTVNSVTPRSDLAPIPLSHSSLAGLANLHKQFVPVFDLSNWVAPGESMEQTGQQTLFLNSDSGPWGFQIDQILGLESIEVSFNGSKSRSQNWSGTNIGSATFRERFVSVLDADALFVWLNSNLRGHWQNLDDHLQESTVA